MSKTGLVHLYYGDGKGKTTEALGLALRALGYNRRVGVVQFLKNTPSGEIAALKLFDNMTVLRGKAGAHFTFAMTPTERRQTKAIHEENFSHAQLLVEQGACDLLILDEVTDALKAGLLDEAMLRKAICQKHAELEIVLTGHYAPDWLMSVSDYITEVKKHKHPYDCGIAAREGVEY